MNEFELFYDDEASEDFFDKLYFWFVVATGESSLKTLNFSLFNSSSDKIKSSYFYFIYKNYETTGSSFSILSLSEESMIFYKGNFIFGEILPYRKSS